MTIGTISTRAEIKPNLDPPVNHSLQQPSLGQDVEPVVQVGEDGGNQDLVPVCPDDERRPFHLGSQRVDGRISQRLVACQGIDVCATIQLKHFKNQSFLLVRDEPVLDRK